MDKFPKDIDPVTLLREWRDELDKMKRARLRLVMTSNYLRNLMSDDKEAKKVLKEMLDQRHIHHVNLGLEIESLEACLKKVEDDFQKHNDETCKRLIEENKKFNEMNYKTDNTPSS